MRFLYRFAADFIWIVHFFVVVIVLFGWLVPSFWFVYIAVVTGALISELLLNYCFLSKWEFDLRKKINQKLNYDYSYTSYYTYKLTHQHLSGRFLARAGIVFTTFSLVVNLYFKFLFVT